MKHRLFGAMAAACACMVVALPSAGDDAPPRELKRDVYPSAPPPPQAPNGPSVVIVKPAPTPSHPKSAAAGTRRVGEAAPAGTDPVAAQGALKNAYVAWTDAQAPGTALLQANDAHRKAIAEMVQCKNCHGDGVDRGEMAKWLGLIVHRNAVQGDLELQALDLQEAEKRVAVAAVDDESPRLGVTVGPVDEVLRAQLGLTAGKGIVVTEVLPDSPAQRGGVEAHDVMVDVGGAVVASEDDLAGRLRESKPDSPPLQIRLIRKGQPVEVQVTPVFPAKKPPRPEPAPAAGAEPAHPHYRIGVQIAAADETLREQLSLADTGVVVLDVLPKTPAERVGLHAYDVITRAGGRPVRSERELSEAVQAAKETKLELEYVRGGKRQYVAVTPKAAPAEPTAAGAVATQPRVRELLMLPPTGQGPDGNRMVVSRPLRWESAAEANRSAADQLDRISDEIQRMRADIEALRAVIAAEGQQKKVKPEKE